MSGRDIKPVYRAGIRGGRGCRGKEVKTGMEYFLMRKDDIVTLCDFSRDGTMASYAKKYRNPELAPLEHRAAKNHLKKWWQNRQIPLSQGRVRSMLEEKGLVAPGEFLLRNLGLSLTDMYWIRPIDSSLKWKDVNLFENDFREDLMTSIDMDDSEAEQPPVYSPNSSLRGELEKSWQIRDGKRVLLKGNHGRRSSESINEVIATRMHEAQGYDNYTPYSLVEIKGKEYDYGCMSESFVGPGEELVSAYAVMTSEKKPEDMTDYEFLIEKAAGLGADAEVLRADLEYQIVSDYLLSNIDRHMENIGFIRDADTLRIKRMAPIFDTGRAFCGRGVVPYTEEEIDEIEVNSFERTENGLLGLLRGRSSFDLSKAIPGEVIEELYAMDSKVRPGHVKNILGLYERKKRRLEDLL